MERTFDLLFRASKIRACVLPIEDAVDSENILLLCLKIISIPLLLGKGTKCDGCVTLFPCLHICVSIDTVIIVNFFK